MIFYEVGPFELRAERLVVTCRGRAVPLGRKAVETLLALVESGGVALSKEVLMERLWPSRFVEESNLAQNVYVLRKAFRHYGCVDSIETLPGFGYRLTALVRRLPDPSLVAERRPFPKAAAVAGALLATALFCGVVAFGVEKRADHPIRPPGLSNEGTRLYAMGRYYWNLRTARGVTQSMQYFRQVIDRDPESPLGYVGMADANESMGDYCYGIHRPSVYFARASVYAAEALRLNPSSGPAHATLGFVALHEGKRSVATTEFRRALTIDPSYAPGHEWYGIALARQNSLREGWLELKLASQLDPLSVSTMAWLSRVAYRDGRIRDAVAYRKEALQMSPDLARRSHPPGHPTWGSVEDAVY